MKRWRIVAVPKPTAPAAEALVASEVVNEQFRQNDYWFRRNAEAFARHLRRSSWMSQFVHFDVERTNREEETS